MPEPPKDIPDTLPPAGRKLAAVALVLGVAQAVWVHLTWWFDGTLSGNALGGYLGVYIAYGLVRGHSAARWLALYSVMCNLLGAVLIAALVLGDQLRQLAGKPPMMEYDAKDAGIATLLFFSVPIAVWAFRVVQRPDVIAYCNGQERGRLPMRFRMVHIVLVTLGVALGAAFSHWNPHEMILNP